MLIPARWQHNLEGYDSFERALKKVLSVSHDEIKTRIEDAKRETEAGFRPRFFRKGLERRLAHLSGHLRKGQPLFRNLR